MNRGAQYRVGVGASSILMIFIVLSLTTLGVLCYASARADLILTQKRQAQVEAYYQADAMAQALLAEIDQALLAAGEGGQEAALEGLADIDPAIEASDGLITIRLPVGDSQTLHVVLRPQAAGSGARYTLVSHCLYNTADWSVDTTLHLAEPVHQD